MGLLNYLEFDGINSLSYGVIISGEGVFDAPKRRAERISVPGRNGDLILDEGVFDNIRVSYPAFIVARNEAEFRERFQAFRSMLLSRASYVKLTDSYHGDEYRMAAYLDGLEVDPKLHNKAGNFTLTFDCKPQRFLKIGEIPVPIESGDTITNPTLFDAKPLIKFNASGNGTMTLGDSTLTFYNKPLGVIPLPYTVRESPTSDNIYWIDWVTLDASVPHNTGDEFTFKGARATLTIQSATNITSATYSINQDLKYIPGGGSAGGGNLASITLEDYAESTFVYGTTKTVTKSVEWKVTTGGTAYTQTISLKLSYLGDNRLQVMWSVALTSSFSVYDGTSSANYVAYIDSTANSLTGDLYMDLDIGEAYKIDGGAVVSINNFVNLGGELPVLPSGETEITFDSTISNVEITPRWWRV